jgi:selenocysteine-specific elongation factor
MRRLILGTAGHIDHGKTALVKALTGVDTDRLKEEKERGITVDLGFAEFVPVEHVRFGVVDVPGHEGFIRNMLAGATGIDVALLVVAADEGVMPQTREHLAILTLLAVPRVVVVVSKTDLVEGEWLDLVMEEIRELLVETPYALAPLIPASVVTGRGLEELSGVLGTLGPEVGIRGVEDVVRLPLDRVFTVRGAGTVVTGTLWTGTLRAGGRARLLPGDQEARIRSLQVHGKSVDEARAGERVAVGLTGTRVSHLDLFRGQTLVEGEGWASSLMLTCRLSVLPGSGWEMEHGQRVRVHLGTAEVMARVALLEGEVLKGGEEGWGQLRLEEPLLARVRDRLVLRSYSPVTTLGGGLVAETAPGKRRSLAPEERVLLDAVLGAPPSRALEALLSLAGWTGVPLASLPQLSGLPPKLALETVGGLHEAGNSFQVESRLFARQVWLQGRDSILSVLRSFHESQPLRLGMPMEELRQVPPGNWGRRLGEALLQALAADGKIRLLGGVASLADFRPRLSREQEETRTRLRGVLESSALSPPNLAELEEALGSTGEIHDILRLMEGEGEVVGLDGGFFFWQPAVREAGLALVSALGGTSGLGPSHFKEILPLSRRHLLPLLRHFDTVGITTRLEEERRVALEAPPGWVRFRPGGADHP